MYKPKPKPKSRNSSESKNRTQVQKVHQVKIENRRFSLKQQYFQVVLRQSPPNVMLYVHFTTRLHRTYNRRTIDSFNNRNIESDNKSVKIEHFQFIMSNHVQITVLSCVVHIPSILVSTCQAIQKISYFDYYKEYCSSANELKLNIFNQTYMSKITAQYQP